MKPSTLQGDLIRDFQEQKKIISEQVVLIDPMATQLRRPAARRLLDAGFLVFMEVVAWLLVIACVGFIVFFDRLYPFYFISQLLHDTSIATRYQEQDIRMLAWATRGLAVLTAITFLIIARMVAAIRKKNSVLNIAGKNMKLLAEQMLRRKASMEMLEQRYPMDMPSDADSVVHPPLKSHDDILL